MTQAEYVNHFIWVIPILIIDIIIPILAFIPKLKKRDEFKFDGRFSGLILTLLVGNCLFSYIVGILAYVKFENEPQASNIAIWIISFVCCIIIEVFIYYKLIHKNTRASIEISMSPNDYKDLILPAEINANKIWLLPKRIHVMFKSPAMIQMIANKRFGVGSEYVHSYVQEHTNRKASLYSALDKGVEMREIHNKSDLISYIKHKTHNGVDCIEKKYLIEMLTEWKRALNQYSSCYFVRLTDEKIPIKYEIIDKKKVVIHESAGNNSRDRLNAIMIESSNVAIKISNDFEQIWEGIPSNETSKEYIIQWIDNHLLPLLN